MAKTRRSKPDPPEPYESTGKSGDKFARIYMSMLESAAFKALTKNQRLLYLYMKQCRYGARKPGKDFPDIEELQGDDKFYFNLQLAVGFKLYSRSNARQFYLDVKALEEHGFIKTISNGRLTKTRSIYQFVGGWKKWNDSS